MKIVKNEDAVSPVIGVILMVAITVILAAVIAAFVFNIGGSQEKTVTAQLKLNDVRTGATNWSISHQGGDALVTFVTPKKDGEITTDDWTNYEIRVNGGKLNATNVMYNGALINASATNFQVGDKLAFTTTALKLNDEITIIQTSSKGIVSSQKITN
jgi:flagellin-like protein